MTSEAWLAALACLALGCDGSVHDRSARGGPLLVVRGHVDVAALERPHPEAPLLGALLWAAVPVLNPVCLASDLPQVREACPDPYGVFPGPVQLAAPIDPDGNFALALSTLPPAGASVGDEVTRITYGALVVLEDVDGNGAAMLAGGGARGAGSASPDVVVAASFHTLRAAQARIVFREGGFVTGSYFYPAPGCPTPPAGFSLLMAPPYPVEGAAVTEGCATGAVDAPIEVPPLAPAQAQAFACRGWGVRGFVENGNVRPAYGVNHVRASDPAPKFADPICLAPALMVVRVMGMACADLLVFALKGCLLDALCAQPEWDETAAPPSWWPCH